MLVDIGKQEIEISLMFACPQNYLLNETALNSLSDEQRTIFIYEWLSNLNQVLGAAQQVN